MNNSEHLRNCIATPWWPITTPEYDFVEFCREMYHSHLIQENVKIKLRVSKLFWMVNMSSARDKERFECDCWAPVVSKRFCYTDHLLSSFLMQMWQSEDLILTAAYDKMPGWEGEKDEMRGEVAGGRRFYVVLFVSCRGGVLRGAEKIVLKKMPIVKEQK